MYQVLITAVEPGLNSLQVLIISGHPLFADAITHLLHEQGIEHVAVVSTITEAQTLLETETPQAIIVDHDTSYLTDSEVVSQLVGRGDTQQVIFLTLEDNRMIVHHRERIENVTPADLIQALHPGAATAAEG
ncbi:MAG: DNA-binding response regulator [Chloroflexi bacterium]|nr:MAG: DNA-binding response regulator [Chloroflexota bacterium]